MESSSKGGAAWENPYSYETLIPLRLSRINGQINHMHHQDLVRALKELKLNPSGATNVLKRRLKNFYRLKKGVGDKADGKAHQYPYLIVIDFEATCERNDEEYPHEIIEFPAILISSEKMEVVDEFHRHCKPTVNPQLSTFCTELTGITQDVVDKADPFPVVLQQFEEWVQSHKLGTHHKFAIVTDGPWDMARFLHGQCCLSELPFPRWGRKWVNVRKIFANNYQHGMGQPLVEMLRKLGLEFEGRLHCGLDDTRNIARIVLHMLEDQVPVKVNEVIKLCGKSKEPAKTEPAMTEPCKEGEDDCNDNDCDAGAGETDRMSMKGDSKHPRSQGNLARGLTRVEDEDDVSDLMQYLAIQKSA